MVLRQDIIYERFGSYCPPAPGSDAFEQAVQWNNLHGRDGHTEIPTNEHMRRHETLMLRTTTTSTPLVQAELQSQSSVAVSAPITTQVAEPEPTPMDIVSEPESKVSELIPTTEMRTSLGFR